MIKTKKEIKTMVKFDESFEMCLRNIAGALEEIATEIATEKAGTGGMTIADSIESIAMDFNRYVNVIEKANEEKKIN